MTDLQPCRIVIKLWLATNSSPVSVIALIKRRDQYIARLPAASDLVESVDLTDEAGSHALHVARLVGPPMSDDLRKCRQHNQVWWNRLANSQ